jgi:NADPH-dependent ferric siderophore reductase
METIKSTIRSLAAERPLLSPTVTVTAVDDLSPGYVRVSLRGDDLGGYSDPHPADGFKLMFPDPASGRPAGTPEAPVRGDDGLPTWGGGQPVLRALTVRSFDPVTRTLTADVARHDRGVLAQWLAVVRPGDRVMFSGMRLEWALPPAVDRAVLAVDAAGVPAAAAVVESLPDGFPADLIVQLNNPADAALLPARVDVAVHVVADLGAVTTDLLPHLCDDGAGRVQGWIAAETSVVRRLRKVLRDGWSVDRGDLLARAYWTRDLDSTRMDAADLVKYRKAMADGADLSDPELAERIALGD